MPAGPDLRGLAGNSRSRMDKNRRVEHAHRMTDVGEAGVVTWETERRSAIAVATTATPRRSAQRPA